jgi:hypothetical protein
MGAERNGIGGRCPPNPLGFFALCMLWQAGGKQADLMIHLLCLAVASLQIGAQVASLQSLILRWSASSMTFGSDQAME